MSGSSPPGPLGGDGERTLADEQRVSTVGDGQRRTHPTADPRAGPPERIGRFQIVRAHGAGGMGFVYVGRDEKLRREVAIKVLRSERNSERNRQRLEREAAALAQLSHPNVVPVFEVGEHEDQLFIAMELVDGDNLRSWLRNGDRSWQEIVGVYLQAARGLAAAHARGLVHRDFKPENALVGNDGRVRVVDFGVVADGESSMTTSETCEPIVSCDDSLRTRTGEFLGTPRYMAPEQFAGIGVGPPADQFAWCVALFEALSRERPFAGTSVSELAAAVTEGRVQPLPAGPYPKAFADVLARGLARDPADRHPDMQALAAAVQAAATPRRRWPWLLAGAGIVCTGLALAIASRPGVDPPPVVDLPPEPAPTPVRLTGPASDMQARAQDAFATGHAALASGDHVLAARWFDAAAAPFERALAHGEDITRIELDRALAHLGAWRSTRVDRHLVIAHELLRRIVDDEYHHPSPAALRARASQALAEIAEQDAALVAARGTDDEAQRFHLQYIDEHPPGTRIEDPDREICREPCTVPLAVDHATVLRLSHPGLTDVLYMARPNHHLAAPHPVAGMVFVDADAYQPLEFPPR